jgi:hypothetical protein
MFEIKMVKNIRLSRTKKKKRNHNQGKRRSEHHFSFGKFNLVNFDRYFLQILTIKV